MQMNRGQQLRKEMFTIKQAIKILNITAASIKYLCKEKNIKLNKYSNTTFISKEDLEKIRQPEGYTICSICLEQVSIEKLSKNKKYCKKCAVKISKIWSTNNAERVKENYNEWFLKNKERRRAAKRKADRKRRADPNKKLRERLNKYNIDEATFKELEKEANGKCMICSKEIENLHIDHDHITKKVRGLLCRHCNTGLGHFGEDINSLESAINYLNKNNPDIIEEYRWGFD